VDAVKHGPRGMAKDVGIIRVDHADIVVDVHLQQFEEVCFVFVEEALKPDGVRGQVSVISCRGVFGCLSQKSGIHVVEHVLFKWV
jgi:hypothetical protein